jgi:RNA polymerase sigma-70 factor (ECF subfamily)
VILHLTLSTNGVTFPGPPSNYNRDDGLEQATAARLDNLMTLYQQADAVATAALIAAVSPALYRYLVYHCRDREVAADLLQETWLRIHRVRHTYRAGESVLPWLYAIARHVRVDGYRRQRRLESHEQAMDTLPEPATVSRPSGPEPDDFSVMVAGLPPAQREVVTMLKVSGMSLEEVARATRSTVGAVKQKAHRAYEKLRALREQTGPGDAPGGEELAK